VDGVWERIRRATEDGGLGGSAKVSTAKQDSQAMDPNMEVIEKDVKRVRKELRRLGISSKIPYKVDSDTISGKYANRGNSLISKYYE
jgi:hypothetical protein